MFRIFPLGNLSDVAGDISLFVLFQHDAEVAGEGTSNVCFLL